jgi:hypothetical protein
MSTPQRRRELEELHRIEQEKILDEEYRKSKLDLWELIQELDADENLKQILNRMREKLEALEPS